MRLSYLIMSEQLKRRVSELSDRNTELLGYLLTRRDGDGGGTVLECVYEDGGPDHALCAPRLAERERLVRSREQYLEAREADPTLVVVSSHVHCVPFDVAVRGYDPYWTVGRIRQPALPGSGLACGRPPERMLIEGPGDAEAFDAEARQYGVTHHLFVHPRSGTEGLPMRPEFLCFTFLRYDSRVVGNAVEAPVLVANAHSR